MGSPDILKELCTRGALKTATAESCTAGLISAMIASVNGSSAYHQGGIVAYNLRQKVALLGVDEAHAESCNCVSERVAREMAKGIRRVMDADIGISITGYAVPNGTIELPYAWIAFDVNGYVWTTKVYGGATRTISQHFYAETAINELARFLQNLFPSVEWTNEDTCTLGPIWDRLRTP